MNKTVEELKAELASLEGKQPEPVQSAAPVIEGKPASADFETYALRHTWNHRNTTGSEAEYQEWRATEGERLRAIYDGKIIAGFASRKREVAAGMLDPGVAQMLDYLQGELTSWAFQIARSHAVLLTS